MIEFDVNDIVRSGFVRDYIIAKMDHESSKGKQSKSLLEIANSVALTE